MVQVKVLAEADRRAGIKHATDALDLARRLPRIAIEARRIAATAAHGIHGRRQAGPGEAFWQYRPFTFGEPAHRVDWRRSARDDRYYVREREWEAAHTIWLWIDRSASMAFSSSLAQAPKVERALVLGLALADAFVEAGERVGLLGLSRPQATRAVVERIAEALVADAQRVRPFQVGEHRLALEGERLFDGIENEQHVAARAAPGQALDCLPHAFGRREKITDQDGLGERRERADGRQIGRRGPVSGDDLAQAVDDAPRREGIGEAEMAHPFAAAHQQVRHGEAEHQRALHLGRLRQ
jgi:hypothetical protein